MAVRTSLFRGFEWCFCVYESSEYHVRGLGRILWNVIGVTFVIGLLVIYPVMKVYIIPIERARGSCRVRRRAIIFVDVESVPVATSELHIVDNGQFDLTI